MTDKYKQKDQVRQKEKTKIHTYLCARRRKEKMNICCFFEWDHRCKRADHDAIVVVVVVFSCLKETVGIQPVAIIRKQKWCKILYFSS